MAEQSRQEPAKFIAGGAAFLVLTGTALIIIATTEVSRGHGIATIGWFKAGLALVILGIVLSIVAAAMFYWPSVFDRVEVDVTPERLTAFFEGVTNAQGQDRAARYIGKWMRVSGSLGNVRSSSSRRALVTFAEKSTFNKNEVYCFFTGRKYVDRLKVKSLGDEVTLIGRITEVDSRGVTLHHCKLDSQRPPSAAQQQLPSSGGAAGLRAEEPSAGSSEALRLPLGERASQPAMARPSAPPPSLDLVQQQPQRVEVDVTPERLTAFFEGVTNAQGQDRAARYIGKWVRVSGSLRDVVLSSPERALVVFKDRSLFSNNEVYCYFRGKDWTDRLAVKNAGDNLTLIGRITEVDGLIVHLDDCELET